MAATIFTALGINPSWQILDSIGRPHQLTPGKPVQGIVYIIRIAF